MTTWHNIRYIQGNSQEVGNFLGGELVLGTWWVGKMLDGKQWVCDSLTELNWNNIPLLNFNLLANSLDWARADPYRKKQLVWNLKWPLDCFFKLNSKEILWKNVFWFDLNYSIKFGNGKYLIFLRIDASILHLTLISIFCKNIIKCTFDFNLIFIDLMINGNWMRTVLW